ncbi:hypothetical protein RB195_004828 [Necator americanus]|uniref:Vta1/callose synthase N-terminal domain-containing protein n=1 Tax=Necator americanus TaxID=51031 RepID=A0ABR1BJV7_NECAM
MAAKVPPSLKPIAHYIKIANENSSRDPVVYYWCLFYAVQTAMQLDKSSPEALHFLTSLLGTLEAIKKQLAGTEAITSEVVAQAHLEDFALKLFNFADAKEKSGQVDKSVVHAFYTAGHVMDVLSLFGEVDETFLNCKKYAKWKSTQIFACLKDGTPYTPSSQQDHEDTPQAGVTASTGNVPPVEHVYPDPTSMSSSSSGSNQPLRPNEQNQPNRGYQSQQFQQPSQPQSNYGSAGLPSVPAADTTPSVERKPPLEAFNEARKFTKYALSAIDYEDTRAVVENLRKALALMERF